MKIAWMLIIIGILLLLEGTSRVLIGVVGSNYLLSAGGIITGWLLGGWLLAKGMSRRKHFNIGEGQGNG